MVENPNTNPAYNLKTRQDLLDQDYLHKLSPKEMAWLDKFNREYVGAGKLNKEEKPLHKKKEQKKDCYDRNNSRNRCILTRQKAQGKLKTLEEIIEKPMNPVNRMDDSIDLKLLGIVDEEGLPKKKD